MSKLTKTQIDILDHTRNRAANNLFCGDSADMQCLIRMGLMYNAGIKSFCPDEFFALTEKGRRYEQTN